MEEWILEQLLIILFLDVSKVWIKVDDFGIALRPFFAAKMSWLQKLPIF